MNALVLLNAVVAAASGGVFLVLLKKVFLTAPIDHGRNWFNASDVAMGFSVSFVIGLLTIVSFSTPSGPISLKTVQNAVIAQMVFAGIPLSYLWARKIPFGEFFGLKKMPLWKVLILALLLIVAVAPVIEIVGQLIHSSGDDDQQTVIFFQKHTGLKERLWLGVMAVVVAPICEEVLFRGFIYGVFQGYFGKISSMFFTSILFAAFHGNLPTLIPLAMLAAGLTIGLELSGSMLVPIFMHSIFNATTLLFLIFAPPS